MPIISAQNCLEFAARALEAYDVQALEVTFIQHSENMTFHVKASQGEYVLRLHVPVTPAFGDHGSNRAAVNSEMLWLVELRKGRFPVPAPVKTRKGEYTAQVDDINVTLLKWLDGELLTGETETEQTAAQIGSLVGRLHQQSAHWTTPRGFTRPTRNAAYFENALLALWPAVGDGRISSQDYSTLQTSISWLTGEVRSLSSTRTTFGLLHGDLHRGNFLIHRAKIRLIDFSMSGFGHYAYDLGTCLSNIRTAHHAAFLENYTQYFSLPKTYGRLVEAYFVGSWVVTFALWITDADSQETLVQRVPFIANEYAERFNRDERFWFNEKY
jgi:Ser/Thr protein kinase RdoA (MazF antagonist)